MRKDDVACREGGGACRKGDENLAGSASRMGGSVPRVRRLGVTAGTAPRLVEAEALARERGIARRLRLRAVVTRGEVDRAHRVAAAAAAADNVVAAHVRLARLDHVAHDRLCRDSYS